MASKPLGLWGVFLICIFCNLSHCLESNSQTKLAIFSIHPADGQLKSGEDSDVGGMVGMVANLEDHNSSSVEPLSFSGIREKLGKGSSNASTSGNGVAINIRGRSGVVLEGNGGKNPTQQKTMRDGVISWDQAFDSSVKRVVVRSRPESRVVPHGRNLVRLQPIVPKVRSVSAKEIVNNSSTSPSPPPHEQVAKMARFIVQNSNWTSMATISTRSPTTGYPFANIFSVSDGTPSNSSGVPYMYMTPLDVSVKDLRKNVKSSLTMSLAQGNYCKSHSFDPEDPRCAHVILTGRVVELTNGTDESDFAREALFSRHPDMQSWPKDHGWFFSKMEIANILVLDYFGGAKSVTIEDYFAAE